MTIQRAKNVGPARIDIAYERLGDPAAPPVLLIMGLGAQLIGWPDGLCNELIQRGLHVIRFDNRDAGESTHMTNAPVPNMMAAMAGNMSSASYTLSDMAADTVGLLDVLDLASVHVVGASMGGFIAQTMAIEHPRRVRSLTSIMSSTGSLAVGQAQPHVWPLLGGPPPASREQAMQRSVEVFGVIGSPGFPADTDAIRDRAGRAYDRGFDPPAFARQGIAVLASGDRTARLKLLDLPALVIHGAADPLVDISGGRATAAAIPGAELLVIEGMGHDLPRGAWSQIVPKIVETRGTRRGAPREALTESGVLRSARITQRLRA